MKILFLRNLHEIYNDIYILVRFIGFTGEYVNEMTPLERGLYKSYYELEKKANQNEKNKNALSDVGLNIEDLL